MEIEDLKSAHPFLPPLGELVVFFDIRRNISLTWAFRIECRQEGEYRAIARISGIDGFVVKPFVGDFSSSPDTCAEIIDDNKDCLSVMCKRRCTHELMMTLRDNWGAKREFKDWLTEVLSYPELAVGEKAKLRKVFL